MKALYVILCTITLLVTSCIKEPLGPENMSIPGIVPDAAFILCEGVWGMDNSLLGRYDILKDSIDADFYGSANPGLRLGDLANDIVIVRDVALIAVTTAKVVEVINAATGNSLGRIVYPQGYAPRRIAVINDSTAAVTDLYKHSISIINFRSMKIIANDIAVGPAPEGITFYDVLLFVVNSGYGDYLADRPKAGFVSVVDAESLSEIGSFYAGPNAIEILINTVKNKLYVSYNNLPSKKDSVGGIAEFDLNNLRELRRTSTDVRSMTLSQTGDSLFFVSSRGVELIELSKDFIPRTIIDKTNKNDEWYSLAYSHDNKLWVGNSFNHQIRGEISIYSPNSSIPTKKFPVGVNPGKIIFFKTK